MGVGGGVGLGQAQDERGLEDILYSHALRNTRKDRGGVLMEAVNIEL